VEEGLMVVAVMNWVTWVTWVLGLAGAVAAAVLAVRSTRRMCGGWNPMPPLVLFGVSLLTMAVGPLIRLWLGHHHLQAAVIGLVAVAVAAGFVLVGAAPLRITRLGQR